MQMTAKQMFNKAIILLGYTDSTGNAQLTERMRSRAYAAINQVYADLHYALNPTKEFVPIKDWEDKIDLPERILIEVAPYGVASFLAMTEGDGEQSQIFASLFNSKRALLTSVSEIIDTIPTVGDEK